MARELTSADVAGSAELGALAEIGFMIDDVPACEVLTPLRIGDRACFALSYDRSDLAARLRSGGELVVAFTDSRLAYKGWKPLVARARCDVFADPEGALFSSKLLEQELRKHPPSRLLIDTPLMRREHWWYVPRWIVRLVEVLDVHPVDRRATPDAGLLVYRNDLGLSARSTTVKDWGAGELDLGAGEDDLTGPALVMTHDFSIPDLEDRSTYVVSGRLNGNRLSVERREGARGLGRRRNLMQRLQRQGQLQRECIQQLRRHGHA